MRAQDAVPQSPAAGVTGIYRSVAVVRCAHRGVGDCLMAIVPSGSGPHDGVWYRIRPDRIFASLRRVGASVASSTDKQVRCGPQHCRADPCGTPPLGRRWLARDHERSGSHRAAQRGHGHGAPGRPAGILQRCNYAVSVMEKALPSGSRKANIAGTLGQRRISSTSTPAARSAA